MPVCAIESTCGKRRWMELTAATLASLVPLTALTKLRLVRVKSRPLISMQCCP